MRKHLFLLCLLLFCCVLPAIAQAVDPSGMPQVFTWRGFLSNLLTLGFGYLSAWMIHRKP
nr:MAG: hypothetical protein [Microviridae sp.]